MSKRFTEWANENAQRSYPFVDGHGLAVPTTLLGGLVAAVPFEADDVWVSHVRATPHMLSVTISSDAGPIGACTLARADFEPYASYPLEALGESGGGWVTFVRFPDEPLDVKLTADDGRLSDNSVRRVPTWPVTSLRLRGHEANALTGIPRIISSDTVAVSQDGRKITLRLKDRSSVNSFLGPCSKSDIECENTPIRRIAGVCANDEGVITLIIRKAGDS